MSAPKHSPAPWALYGDADQHVRTDAGAMEFRVYKIQHREDAARIVVCVNACEGIADPSAVKEMLKALEEINTAACYASEVNTDAREAVLLRIGKLARQAIAKAEGRSDE